MRTVKQNLPECKSCSIRSSALFGHIDMQMLDKVRALRTCQIELGLGEFLYRQGDKPSSAFTLYSGWMVLYKTTQNGDRHIIRFALPGEFLGYKVGANATHDHTAQALNKVALCSFPIDRILSESAQQHHLVVAIQSMNESTMERCHSTISTIANKTAEAKVAFLLLTLYARDISVSGQSEEYIMFPLTQEDIGDALGLTTVHVNRVIQGLRNKKLITCKQRCLNILNVKKLATVAQLESFEYQQFGLDFLLDNNQVT